MLHGSGVSHGLLSLHAHHVGQLDLGLGRLQQALLNQLLPCLLALRLPLRPQLLVLLCPNTRSFSIRVLCLAPASCLSKRRGYPRAGAGERGGGGGGGRCWAVSCLAERRMSFHQWTSMKSRYSSKAGKLYQANPEMRVSTPGGGGGNKEWLE